MTPPEAHALLRRFQAWRTGQDERTLDDAGLHPRAITQAIDIVLADTGVREALARENSRLRRRLQKAYRTRSEIHSRLRALREVATQTLQENRHLADGDDCTLHRLKTAIGFECPRQSRHTPNAKAMASADARLTPKETIL